MIIEARVDVAERDPVMAELRKRGLYWQEVGQTLFIFQPDSAPLDGVLRERLVVLGQRVPTLEDVFLRLTGRALNE